MNYRKLLEKYMRDVVECEGTAFIYDVWGGEYGKYGYSFAEHAHLLKLKEKIYKEEKL